MDISAEERAKGKTVEVGKATFAPPDSSARSDEGYGLIFVREGRVRNSGAGTASHNDALSEGVHCAAYLQRRRQVRPLRKAWRKPETQSEGHRRGGHQTRLYYLQQRGLLLVLL